MRGPLTAVCLLWVLTAQAAIDAYEFKSDADLERYERLTYELRCPKCQNNNIRDSNAPIAKDLRREVYRMINEGKTDEEIIQFMLDRYGQFVLYRPPLNGTTSLIWFGPLVVLILALGGVGWAVRRKARQSDAQDVSLTEEEAERLKALLEDTDKRSTPS
ncbi:cytochrome c-type biogenesis protein [Hahella sp. SMD15-11]|uniref:Cytochrome c-type biogenesis protein n=1 Tax=Thermohahella caldifontis TaxID=3142973 RepID=A0AB39UWQ5_9GAMM